jgi:hypothetical protein
MTKPNVHADAIRLVQSPRGQYILSQALTVAIETLESVEPPAMRELSNIEDMRFIRDNLFPIYKDVCDSWVEVKT